MPVTYLEQKLAAKAAAERAAYRCPPSCEWCGRTYFDGRPVRHGNGWVIVDPDGVVTVEVA